MIGHNLDMVELIDDGVIHHRNQVPFDSLDDGVKQLEESFDVLLEKLGTMDEDRWNEQGRFSVEDHAIMEPPREHLAWLLLLDSCITGGS